jgi:hypothetical protein
MIISDEPDRVSQHLEDKVPQHLVGLARARYLRPLIAPQVRNTVAVFFETRYSCIQVDKEHSKHQFTW